MQKLIRIMRKTHAVHGEGGGRDFNRRKKILLFMCNKMLQKSTVTIYINKRNSLSVHPSFAIEIKMPRALKFRP